MTTTSGLRSRARWTAVAPSLASAIDFHVGLSVDEQAQAVPDRHVVVGEENAERWSAQSWLVMGRRAGGAAIRRKTVVPLPAVDSISTVAPTSAARSCMPSSPNPPPADPSASGSNPTPSSSTMRRTESACRSRMTSTRRGARVLRDVGQRFLRDAVERRLGFRREPFVEEAGRVELGRDVDAPRPVLNVVGEGRAQAEVVERGRAELPDELVDVAIDLARDRLQRVDERRRCAATRRTRP